MNTILSSLTTFLIALTLILGGVQDAEAKRFGGARSFGGKSAYRTPYRQPTGQRTRSARQQQAYQQNQAARQKMASRGGLMGMLGGLAIGGLLGSMLFGGAFENINLLDILVFGGIAYLLIRMLAARAGPVEGRSQQHPAFRNRSIPETNVSDFRHDAVPTAGFDTDVLFNKTGVGRFRSDTDTEDADFGANDIQADFDQENFLSGARSAFLRLQAAWDNRDLNEIRGLTTERVFEEIQEQLSADDRTDKTDVLKVNAELLEIRKVAADLEAVVLFDCIIREEIDARAEQVREVWHFVKPVNSSEPTWFLDGIQQLED